MTLTECRSAIAAANEQFMDAVRRRDAGTVASLYTTDGQLLPPHCDIVTGRIGIRAFWQGVFDLGLTDATLETIEAKATNGHFAVEVGRYTLFGKDGQMVDTGKYVVVWRNDAGTWLLHQDIWNSNRPAPKP